MKLLAIIVNYKTADMTLEALSALLRELEGVPSSHVVVVDNDSQDGSHAKLSAAVRERGWGDRVEVVASDRNGGFGYGNNLAIRPWLTKADAPEYFLLLNSDAFPEPGSMKTLVGFMDAHPNVGMAGAYIHGPDGTPHETAFRFPTVMSELETSIRLGVVSKLLEPWVVAPPLPTSNVQVDWVGGPCMIIRRKVFEAVGLFDETFFLYFEETDLCRRAALAGWPTFYVREASVAHIGSASTGMKDHSKRMPAYWFASRRHYFLKNHGRAYLEAANVAWVVGFSTWRLRRKLQNKPDPDRPKLLSDFIRFNVFG